MLVIVSGTQLGVGTDYFTYYKMYSDELLLDRFYMSKEYFFYFFSKLLSYLNFSAQSIFICYAFFTFSFVFISFSYIEKNTRIRFFWLFVIFFITTGFFHNQMNLLRQYLAAAFLFSSVVFLFNGKYIRFLILATFAISSHPSAIIVLLFFPFLFVKRVGKNWFFTAYFTSTLAYISIIPFFIDSFVSILFPQYSFYLDSSRSQGHSVFTYVTKLYFIPVYLFCLYFIYKNWILFKHNTFLLKLMLVWSLTSSIYLLGLHYGISDRVYHYFLIFNIVPFSIYFSYCRHGVKSIFIFAYLLLPYLAKVTFLAKAEYLYKSWVF
tara:strand:+ start:367 stop:1332 length:966 start_codon:yes stop_codon:yes gene_type:complete